MEALVVAAAALALPMLSVQMAAEVVMAQFSFGVGNLNQLNDERD
jgi:hypothetical protein